MTCVEGDVALIDCSCCLERGFDFGKRTASFDAIAKELGVVRAVDVHLKFSLVGQDTGLPVLFEMIRSDHANGLNFHRFEAKRDDIVHSFNDGSPFA